MDNQSILDKILGQANDISDSLIKQKQIKEEQERRKREEELEKQKMQEQARHNAASEKAQLLSAQNLGAYHNAVAADLADRRLIDKYKVLGIGANGKPLGSEAQKSKNLLTAAENSLGETQRLINQNTGSAILEKILPNALVNLVGGKPKEIMDSKSVTKEGLQNYATGAAASGEQVPAFQSWSGPGLVDIIKGNTGVSKGMSDTIKTLKEGYDRPQRQITENDLRMLHLDKDPAARAMISTGSPSAAVAAPQASEFDPSKPINPNASPEQKAARRQYLRAKRGQ